MIVVLEHRLMNAWAKLFVLPSICPMMTRVSRRLTSASPGGKKRDVEVEIDDLLWEMSEQRINELACDPYIARAYLAGRDR